MKRYRLLKDIESPLGSCKAGSIGECDKNGHVWFDNKRMYFDNQTCAFRSEWFELIPDRVQKEQTKEFQWTSELVEKMVWNEWGHPDIRHRIRKFIEEETHKDDIGIDRNGYSTEKKYTEYQLNEAMEKSWDAARETKCNINDPTEIRLHRIVLESMKYFYSNPTFQDYLNTIKP